MSPLHTREVWGRLGWEVDLEHWHQLSFKNPIKILTSDHNLELEYFIWSIIKLWLWMLQPTQKSRSPCVYPQLFFSLFAVQSSFQLFSYFFSFLSISSFQLFSYVLLSSAFLGISNISLNIFWQLRCFSTSRKYLPFGRVFPSARRALIKVGGLRPEYGRLPLWDKHVWIVGHVPSNTLLDV